MSYSPIANKTLEELYAELKAVFDAYSEYNSTDPEYDYPTHGSFFLMAEKFAYDDFYHCHLTAQKYLELYFRQYE